MYHLGGKFIVNNKFVGAFSSPKESFVVQRIFLLGREEVLVYKHFPLPSFLTGKRLSKWEREIERSFVPYVPISRRWEFLRKWIGIALDSSFVGIGNYLTLEEAVKETDLVVSYELKGKRLVFGKNAFKPVPDRKAVSYLLPCGCFPETILKLGVSHGD